MVGLPKSFLDSMLTSMFKNTGPFDSMNLGSMLFNSSMFEQENVFSYPQAKTNFSMSIFDIIVGNPPTLSWAELLNIIW